MKRGVGDIVYVVLLVGISIVAVAAFYGYTSGLYEKNQTKAAESIPQANSLAPIYIGGVTYEENAIRGTAKICTVSSADTNGCTLVVEDAVTGITEVNAATVTNRAEDIYITCATVKIPQYNKIIVKLVCSGERTAETPYTIVRS